MSAMREATENKARVAEIIPILRLPRQLSAFDYLIPADLAEKAEVGRIAKIPFRGRTIFGAIARIRPSGEKTPVARLKSIYALAEENAFLTGEQIELAKKTVERCGSGLPTVIKAMLPDIPKRKAGKTPLPASHFSPETTSFFISKSSLPGVKKAISAVGNGKAGETFLLFCRDQRERNAIFLKAAEKTASYGKQTMVLVPKISDIPLLCSCFEKKFKGKISVLHGNLSKTALWHEWNRIRSHKSKIIVGTRSAVFAPVSNLGLIVISEEESSDYKQEDQNPRYDARTAAADLANLTGAKLVLSGQAPRVESFYKSRTKKYNLLELQATSYKLQAKIIDMREEIRRGNYLPISEELSEAISSALEKNQKILLFLNRLGLSTLVTCKDCGHFFSCPECGLPLSYRAPEEKHGAGKEKAANISTGFLACPRCKFQMRSSLFCPKCKGVNIKFLGTGIQGAEKELKKLFPGSRILKIDKGSAGEISPETISSSDIILGTRSLFENYHVSRLEGAGLLGVLSADTLLRRPDFRSAEKTFRFLSEAAAWAERKKISRLVIQTYSPENYAVRNGAERNYENFYEKEIEERKNFNYPPFARLTKLIFRHSDAKEAEYEGRKLAGRLSKYLPKAEIIGPFVPAAAKAGKKFVRQIIVRQPLTDKNDPHNDLFRLVPDDWIIETDPESIL